MYPNICMSTNIVLPQKHSWEAESEADAAQVPDQSGLGLQDQLAKQPHPPHHPQVGLEIDR